MICRECNQEVRMTDEAKRRAWSRIPEGQYVARRAMEIAMAGAHTLAFVGDWDAAMCAAAGRVLGVIGCTSIKPCLCGNLGDPGRECRCSSEDVARHRAGYLVPNLAHYQMALEVGRVVKTLSPNSEGWEPVRDRIARTWERALTSRVGLEFDQEGERLLELAVKKLGLNAWEVGNVREVALTIAKMDDGPGGVQARHVAEAIAYVPGRLGRF